MATNFSFLPVLFLCLVAVCRLHVDASPVVTTDHQKEEEAISESAKSEDDVIIGSSEHQRADGDDDDFEEVGTDESFEDDFIKTHFEPAGCPGVDGCLHCCPMGRKRDATGCFSCACKEDGHFEGDIDVTAEDYGLLMDHYDATAPVPPGGEKDSLNLVQYEWPRKGDVVVVPYTMDKTISGLKKKQILEAIKRYDKRTCIRFQPRAGEKDYVEYYGIGGCSSHIGKVGGKQQIKIGRNCEMKIGTVIHEMLHALGFWHEQSRGDRDDWVTIVWKNVMDVAKGNFEKQERFWENYGSPYDVGSVMHYGGDYFAKKRGTATIIEKKTGKQIKAQRKDFSVEDVRQLNLKYKCKDYLKKEDLEKIESHKHDDTKKCEDLLLESTCQQFSQKGLCKQSASHGLKCQKTCGFCGDDVAAATVRRSVVDRADEDDDCRDELSSCKKWSNEGFCEKLSIFMEDKCPRSCGKCGKKKEETEIEDQSSSRCRDFSKNCAEWTKFGFCKSTRYTSYMRRVCTKSCGVCVKDVEFPVSEPVDIEIYMGKCGISDPKLKFTISERIVGGKPSFHGSIPWQGSLFDKFDRHLCGATLIGDRHLLTAAHCFNRISDPDVKSYYVYLGKHHRKSNVHDKGERRVTIEKILIHPEYNPQTSNNDIALLKTKETLAFTNYIRPVCLPASTDPSLVGKSATVSGWGETKDAKITSDVLRRTDVEVISRSDCNKWLSKIYGRANEVTENMICAGYEEGGRDSCQGDSGGPLVVEENGSKILIGLVSWGYGCGEVYRPGVYTKVQNYLDWIKLHQN